VLVSGDVQVLPAEPGKTVAPCRHQQDMTLPELRPALPCGGGPPLDVAAWRRCRLVEAGFPLRLAELLAVDPRYDLHALLELVDRGCPPPLAVRIHAPLPEVDR
jgi:hypothetical protein